MDDFSRFIRYVIPGLVSSLQFYLFVRLSFKDNSSFLNSGISGVSLLVVSFLGTGALGFIFSNIYHFSFKRNDHKNILIKLAKHFSVKYKLEKNNQSIRESKSQSTLHESIELVKNLCITQRWELFNLIWHTLKHKSKAMQDTEKTAERLLNIARGLGATIVGSIIFWTLSCLFTVIACVKDYKVLIHISLPFLYLAIWVIIIVIFYINYHKVHRAAGKLYDEALHLYFKNNFNFEYLSYDYDPI
jgi:hypothetical protein